MYIYMINMYITYLALTMMLTFQFTRMVESCGLIENHFQNHPRPAKKKRNAGKFSGDAYLMLSETPNGPTYFSEKYERSEKSSCPQSSVKST